MRSSRLGPLLVLLVFAKGALAQVPVAPAVEPAAPAASPLPAPEPTPPAEPPPAEPTPTPPPESAPAPDKVPELAPPPPAVPPSPPEPVRAEPRVDVAPAAETTPWVRARSPLTLEGGVGFLLRPESSAGFDSETHTGAALSLSLYADLKRELAAGIELERASLGRGSAISGLNSVNADYTVTSAMLGVRAYPKRTDLFDLFVGIQLGVGIQGVSATGTSSTGALLPASAYQCSGSDTPAFQIGGGIGARLMLSPRWGLSARVNGTGRRLSSEVLGDCAQGIGTATTVSAGLGLGYDFELD